MASTSLLQSSFDPSDPSPSQIAFTNKSLDHTLLKIQPIINVSQTLNPLAIDSTFNTSKLIWLSKNLLVILMENKDEFWIYNVNTGEIIKKINLQGNGKCGCIGTINSIKYLFLSDGHRIYKYAISENENIEEIENWTVDIPEGITQIIFKNEKLILISNSIYLYDLKDKAIIKNLNLFVEMANYVKIFNNLIFVSSNNDRFINLIDLEKFKVISVFVMEENCIKFEFTEWKGSAILVALNVSGNLEIFNDPLNLNQSINKKKRRQTVKSIQTTCVIKLIDGESIGRFDDFVFDNGLLILGYLQNESFFVFDRFDWIAADYSKKIIEIFVIKSNLNKLNVNTSDKASFKTYKEHDVTIRTGENLFDIEDANENEGDDDDDDDDFDDDFASLTSKLGKSSTKKGGKLQFQIGTLTMNLTQALKNNDTAQFDILLNNTHDENVIRETIYKLDSHYVMKLLDKLAELSYKNKFKNFEGPGVNSWIKFLLIFHGNYIIGLSHLKSKLNLLTLSMNNRAKNLDRFLELRGKIELVTQRIEIMKEIEIMEGGNSDIDAEEEGVEYLEELEDVGSDFENDGVISSDEEI